MIELQHVSKAFGSVQAIDDLSLTVKRGEIAVLIGRSGSGKSTTLKMMNRLVEHDAGRILFAGYEIRSFRPEDIRRRMGYAIQSVGLFPHWTVEKNIATVPSMLRWPAERISARVAEMLELLHLDPVVYRRRYPHQLSGGEQQRVGVARALAGDPEVLLMDEPFGSLDPITRTALQGELARIHRVSGKTIVLVTHDIDEAFRLATRVIMLDRGRVMQIGTPLEILTQPANAFVTDFVGTELGVRLLALETVRSRMRRGEVTEGAPIAEAATLREALSVFVARQLDRLAVTDSEGRPIGSLHFADLVKRDG